MFSPLVALLALAAAAAPSPSPLDRWPEHFTSFWVQYITGNETDAPPYAAGFPSGQDVERYYGTTWYDYTGEVKKQVR